jgi:hypothetical protein
MSQFDTKSVAQMDSLKDSCVTVSHVAPSAHGTVGEHTALQRPYKQLRPRPHCVLLKHAVPGSVTSARTQRYPRRP